MALGRLSIVVPAWNEARRLPHTLERLAAYAEARLTYAEILVVDDGSTDETAQLARAFAARTGKNWRCLVLSLGKNQGKGAAVRAGMLAATEERVLMTDADLSTPIEEVETLWKAGGYAEVVLGSRAAEGATITQHQPYYRESMGKLFNQAVQVVVTLGIRDTQCGFKLFKREAARAIFSRTQIDRFAFDVEALFLARKLGLGVVEVPVCWHHSAQSHVNPLTDSARMLLDLWRIRRLHR